MAKKGNITAIIYAAMIPGLQDMAAQHGYALAVHGSMQRDFDLVAIPWREENVSPPDVLVRAISASLEMYQDPEIPMVGPTQKPHGRLAWSIVLGGAGMFLDISVMPTKDVKNVMDTPIEPV